MPGVLFFVSELFFVLSWGTQGVLIIYIISKIIEQKSNWIHNAESLYTSQRKFKKVSYLIFFFLMMISVRSFDINNENCFSCLQRWYKYNVIVSIVTFIGYIVVKILCSVYKTEKYYEPTIKSFVNQKMFSVILTIIVCSFMATILRP